MSVSRAPELAVSDFLLVIWRSRSSCIDKIIKFGGELGYSIFDLCKTEVVQMMLVH